MSSFCEPKSAGSTVETPAIIFDPLNAEFGFQRDVCATPENSKCSAFYSIDDDSLAKSWSGMLWMNPPYGRGIGKWIQKAYDSACTGDATVVCLLPVRSDNEWWKLVIKSEIRFIRGRLQFVGMVNKKTGKPQGCMFPCCVAIFHAYLDPGGIMKVWKP